MGDESDDGREKREGEEGNFFDQEELEWGGAPIQGPVIEQQENERQGDEHGLGQQSEGEED